MEGSSADWSERLNLRKASLVSAISNLELDPPPYICWLGYPLRSGMEDSSRKEHPVASLTDDLLLEILSRVPYKSLCRLKCVSKTTRTHPSSISSSIRPSQQDSLLYTQFTRTHPSSISSSIHSIHCGTDLSLYLNISMCDLVLKDLLRRI
jgi:hypothetical protein